MAIDDLKNMARGWIKNWNKGILQKKLQQTAQEAIDSRVKIDELSEKVRQLEDQVRQLKGEKPRPVIRPVNSKELEKGKNKSRRDSERSAPDQLEVDEEVKIPIEKKDLPDDAKYVGQREVVVQDLIFKRQNIKFVIDRYYSASMNKVFEGELPLKYQGHQFGPGLRSFIVYQHYKNRVPHQKIQDQLEDFKIYISAGAINNLLSDLSPGFAEDLESAMQAGIKRTGQVFIDDTGAKLSGQNAYTFGVSNQYFTFYKTALEKIDGSP